ncbi:MAG TPA: TIGR01777 family oxidoreductase [Holophagaceae bacterium]
MAEQSLSRAVVAGGTGLVGRALVKALLAQGAEVVVLTRRPASAVLPAGARAQGWEDPAEALEGADAVFNLAGEGIADQRWSARRKKALLQSRIAPTEDLVEGLKACTRRPAVLVNASAIGYYGARADDAPVSELDPAGSGFLPEVCRAWEAAALSAKELGVRVAVARIGVVLARRGGALPKMALPVRLFAGSRLGHGRQGFSWIHLHDLVEMLLEAARNPAWEGPFNATAPEPVSQAVFLSLLAKRLHRPLLPIPGLLAGAALRLALGELGRDLLLSGAYVHPGKAEALGFPFRFPSPEDALLDLL